MEIKDISKEATWDEVKDMVNNLGKDELVCISFPQEESSCEEDVK